MKIVKNKQFFIISAIIILLLVCYFFLFEKSTFKEKNSISMAGMLIKEKYHNVEPGKIQRCGLSVTTLMIRGKTENDTKFISRNQ
jgi:hypothetical protein